MARDETNEPASGQNREGTETASIRVLVAVATFRRPAGLARTLDGIAALRAPTGATVSVLVVDNCPDGSAADLVTRRIAGFPFRLTYAHERERGISHARNRALDGAVEREMDFLGFLDDDETPSPGWLASGLAMATHTGAAAVVGPVHARFAEQPSEWMRRGGFFDVVTGPDGATVTQNTAGNALLRMGVIRQLGLRFDPAFALTGGEDTRFFGALRAAGEETRYAAGALVIEDVSVRRASLGWLLARWRRTGITAAMVARAERDSLSKRARLALGGLLRLGFGAVGALVTAPGVFAARPTPYRCLRIACRGLGFIAGAAGYSYEEYRVDRK